MANNTTTKRQDLEVNANGISCENCGSKYAYDPDKCELVCLHCGSTKAFERTSVQEQNIEKILTTTNKQWAKDNKSMTCKNCGAQEVVPRDTISIKCPFCGSVNVVEDEHISGMKPTGIVPFKFGVDMAAQFVAKWAKKKWYIAPNSFVKKTNSERITGTYNPVFTFDASTMSVYEGVIIIHHTSTDSKGRTRTRVEYRRISGTYALDIDDLVVEASDKIPGHIINDLGPMDTNNASKYDNKFLQGYVANQFTKSGELCWEEGKKRMEQTIQDGIISQYHCDGVQSLTINTDYSNLSFKYLLIPIYVGYNVWQNKNYNFFINGETGVVRGKIPKSWVKTVGWIALLLAVCAGIFLAVMFNTDGGDMSWAENIY